MKGTRIRIRVGDAVWWVDILPGPPTRIVRRQHGTVVALRGSTASVIPDSWVKAGADGHLDRGREELIPDREHRS